MEAHAPLTSPRTTFVHAWKVLRVIIAKKVKQVKTTFFYCRSTRNVPIKFIDPNYICLNPKFFIQEATKAPKTSTTVISSSEEITPSQSKKDKDTPKSTTVKSSKQSNKGSSNKSNSKEGDNFDPASLLRGGGNAPPPDDNQQSESAKNDKPSKSNSDHSPSKEIKAILKENGGNDTFDEVTTEEPIPTTTIAPINPVIEKLVSKLLDSNNAVYTNGLHDIKSKRRLKKHANLNVHEVVFSADPDPCEDHQCTNGGECIPDKNDKNGYICKCHGEYDGPFCQCKDVKNDILIDYITRKMIVPMTVQCD